MASLVSGLCSSLAVPYSLNPCLAVPGFSSWRFYALSLSVSSFSWSSRVRSSPSSWSCRRRPPHRVSALVLCSRPALLGDEAFPCGQCRTCRINRKRVWVHRIKLEALASRGQACFVTLTYDDAHLPPDGGLVPRDVTLWLKRLRQLVLPVRFRYFGCGEYGEQGLRPHYHAILFGLGSAWSSSIAKAWGLGFVHVGYYSDQAAAYVAGYVLKKWDAVGGPHSGLRAPFSFMSRNPGIGVPAVPAIADALGDSVGMKLVSDLGDVPTSLNHGGRPYPLGRLLRREIREALGFEHTGGQAKPAAIRQAQMRALQEAAGSRKAYLEQKPMIERQRIRQVITKARIYGRKGKL